MVIWEETTKTHNAQRMWRVTPTVGVAILLHSFWPNMQKVG